MTGDLLHDVLGTEPPSRWGSRRLKHLFHLRRRAVRQSDEIVTAFRDGVVTLRRNRRTEGFTNALQEIGYQGVRRGDLVIHAMDGFAGAIGVSDSDGKSTPVYSVCEPRAGVSDSRYYAYLLRSLALHGVVQALARGIRERSTEFRWKDAGNLPLPMPSVEEQRAIADFLDRETAQIDAMVDAQERLIALLEERRIVVIDQAVTQGLDPGAHLTRSGVPWIGDTPAHWTIQRVGHLGTTWIGLTYSPHDIVDDPTEGTLVLRAGNIRDGKIVLDSTVYVDVPIPTSLRLQAGDIVICARSGSADLVGKSAMIPDRLVGQTWGAFMTVMRSPINDYLVWVLASSIFRRQVGLFSTSTINQLTNSTLNSMRIPVPPDAEQLAIANYLTQTINRIDATIAKAQESIALMKERRAALISAAVTGRIDVRTGAEQVERELEEAMA